LHIDVLVQYEAQRRGDFLLRADPNIAYWQKSFHNIDRDEAADHEPRRGGIGAPVNIYTFCDRRDTCDVFPCGHRSHDVETFALLEIL